MGKGLQHNMLGEVGPTATQCSQAQWVHGLSVNFASSHGLAGLSFPSTHSHTCT